MMRFLCFFLLGALLLLMPRYDAAAAELPDGFYEQYGAVLQRFVNDEGMVDYAALKADRGALDQFVESLGALPKETLDGLSEDEKLAFWINAYNALTLKLIIDNYPIKAGVLSSLVYPKNSIRQIPGAWDKVSHKVAGDALTLDTIEHGIIRKEFNRPGIHMALVCAAVSCPKLRNEPYVGATLDAQLQDQARHFFSTAGRFRIDREKKEVKFSPIFDWFGEDFVKRYGSQPGFEGYGKKDRAILNYAAQHLSEEDKRFLKSNNLTISFLDYDWSLNEQKRS